MLYRFSSYAMLINSIGYVELDAVELVNRALAVSRLKVMWLQLTCSSPALLSWVCRFKWS